MTEISLQLKDGDLQRLAQEAILNALDENSKKAIIAQALEHLFAKGSGFGNKTSMIEDAFKSALSQVAMQVAREAILNDPAISARIRDVLAASFEKCLVADRDKTIEKIAYSLTEAMTCHGSRY